MKRYRQPLGHINHNTRLRIQPAPAQLQQLASKKSLGVHLPPLNLSPPKTARIPEKEDDFAEDGNDVSTVRTSNVTKTSTNNYINENETNNENNQNLNGPFDPNYVLTHMNNLLFDFEKMEIKNYNEIFYVRQNSPKMRVYTPVIPNFFQFVQNDHIAYRYQQLELMGKGAFGSVIKCYDHKNGRRVAVKMIRDQAKYHDQTRLERDILKEMQACPRTVRFLKSFTFRGFFCIVTELLYKDCYTVLRGQRYYGFNKATLQVISLQIAEALSFVHQKGYIHCDIKPENIMFTNRRKVAVKLVDFGCSCLEKRTTFSYIQSRYFRAPEVVLGKKYGREIDVWSYACVLAELFSGKPLFPASSERELMEMVVAVIGEPPLEFLKESKRAEKFFDSNGSIKRTANPRFRKVPLTPLPNMSSNFTNKINIDNSNINTNDKTKNDEINSNKEEENNNNMDNVVPKINIPQNITQPIGGYSDRLESIFGKNEDMMDLVDLIRRCLKWKPEERITMDEILRHQWFSESVENHDSPSNQALPSLLPLTVR